jgi:hypothetical protein
VFTERAKTAGTDSDLDSVHKSCRAAPPHPPHPPPPPSWPTSHPGSFKNRTVLMNANTFCGTKIYFNDFVYQLCCIIKQLIFFCFSFLSFCFANLFFFYDLFRYLFRTELKKYTYFVANVFFKRSPYTYTLLQYFFLKGQ